MMDSFSIRAGNFSADHTAARRILILMTMNAAQGSSAVGELERTVH